MASIVVALTGAPARASDVPVLSDRRIDVPGLPAATVVFNPSVVPYGDGAIMAFRADNTDYWRSARIGLVQLDADFHVVGEPSLLDLRPDGMTQHTAEDPRLLWQGDTLYLVFNQTRQPQPWAPRSMHLASLGVAAAPCGVGLDIFVQAYVSLHVPHDMPERPIEKNWDPFVYNDALHFLYYTNAPHVLRLPDDAFSQGQAVAYLQHVSREAPTVLWPHGEMRGGSPAIWQADKDVYAAFFHGRFIQHQGFFEKVNLTIGFYTFAPEPPFAITGVIAAPIEAPGLHAEDTLTLSCAYPGSFLQRGNSLFVAYGFNDHSAHVLEVDRGAVFAALQPAVLP